VRARDMRPILTASEAARCQSRSRGQLKYFACEFGLSNFNKLAGTEYSAQISSPLSPRTAAIPPLQSSASGLNQA